MCAPFRRSRSVELSRPVTVIGLGSRAAPSATPCLRTDTVEGLRAPVCSDLQSAKIRARAFSRGRSTRGQNCKTACHRSSELSSRSLQEPFAFCLCYAAMPPPPRTVRTNCKNGPRAGLSRRLSLCPQSVQSVQNSCL